MTLLEELVVPICIVWFAPQAQEYVSLRCKLCLFTNPCKGMKYLEEC